MGRQKYRYETITMEDLTQADGAQTVVVNNESDYFNISAFGATAGSIAFEVKVVDGGEFENIVDPLTTNQQVLNFTANDKSFILRSFVYEIRATPTGVTGAYTLSVQQGEY